MHPWAQLGLEVLVAGPDTMTDAVVNGMAAQGVPLHRIHFDQYDSSG